MDRSPFLEKLRFDPSLQEQLILPKIHDHNLMLVYSTDEALIRIQSLIILFYLNQSSQQKASKILILSKKSKQLKHQEMLKSYLTHSTTVLNGSILPNARNLDYNRYSVVFSTPRTTKNDLNDAFFSSDHFSLILVNQAEIASSSSSLRFLLNKLSNFRIIGFTQVTKTERLEQISKNLFIEEVLQLEEQHPLLDRSNIQHYSVPLSQEYFFILEILDQIKKHELKELNNLGFDVSVKSTYQNIASIHESLKEENNVKQLIRTSNLMRIIALQRIVVSQGFPAVLNYFEKLESRLENEKNFQGKQALIEFLNDLKIQKLREFIIVQKHLKHPKSQMILKMISQYGSGISIVTHNYYNANFLKEYLLQQGLSVIQIEEPISSLTELNLKRAILSFTEKKVRICITNTVNDLIAQNSNVIIAYDVNADIVETLNSLAINIPKVFLLAKQTNEEARFFYLKRLGTKSQNQRFDFNALNTNLKDISSDKKDLNEEILSKVSPIAGEELKSKISLKFGKTLYELGIPYLFSKKKHIINTNDKINFPGFIVNQKICFLLLVPDTTDFFIGSKNIQLFPQLTKEYTQTHLILFQKSLENLSFTFRCDLIHSANKSNVWVSLLSQDDEIPKLVKRVLEKPIYKEN